MGASIWTLKLFNRCCDICKDLRFEILAIADSKSLGKKSRANDDPAQTTILAFYMSLKLSI